MGTESLLRYVKPPSDNATPEDVRNWRLVVSGSIIVLSVHILWSMGVLFGLPGFAVAGDIDAKIEAAVGPINDRLLMIETAQTAQSGFLKTLVKNDFARLIRNELRARCKATSSEEKSRINAAIDTYQIGYKDAAGERYIEPDCEDL